MEKGVIIFSIDDGRRDMYRLAKEIFIPQNVPATLNITTNKEWFKELIPIETDELLEIAQSPLMEIANHADEHTNEFDDIQKGFLTLCDLLGYDKSNPIGFASPGSQMSMEYIRDNIEALNKVGVKYVRTCREDYFNRPTDTVALTSYPVTFDTSLETLKEVADTAAENKYCLIYLFHSVLKEGEENYDNTWSYDYDKFKELVTYIKELKNQNKVDVMTTMQYVNMQLAKQ